MITKKEYLLKTAPSEKYPCNYVRSNACLPTEGRSCYMNYPRPDEDMMTVIAKKKRFTSKWQLKLNK